MIFLTVIAVLDPATHPVKTVSRSQTDARAEPTHDGEKS